MSAVMSGDPCDKRLRNKLRKERRKYNKVKAAAEGSHSAGDSMAASSSADAMASATRHYNLLVRRFPFKLHISKDKGEECLTHVSSLACRARRANQPQ